MARRQFPPAHASVPNLAPMIDVVMVILIFFMLGTTFAISEGAIKARLPAQAGPGGAAQVTLLPTIYIHLRQVPGGDGCTTWVMGQQIEDGAPGRLAEVLGRKRSEGVDRESLIQITADARVRYQHVISALDGCTRAGFANVQISLAAPGATIRATP